MSQDAELERLRGVVQAVESWAAENEIAAPPLDWAGLGDILLAAAADAPQPQGCPQCGSSLSNTGERMNAGPSPAGLTEPAETKEQR